MLSAAVLHRAPARVHAQPVGWRSVSQRGGAAVGVQRIVSMPSAPSRAMVSSKSEKSNSPGRGSMSLRAELRPTLEMIRRNIELESRLIDDLLDLTRVTQGKLLLNLEAVDVHELLRHAVQICVSAATHKQLKVVQEFHATVSTVRADSGRLLQVIWNLIQNAVKFTPDHGSIEVRTSDGKENCIRIEIVDNGIGIAPEVMPKIFDAFEQGDTAISRRFGGVGKSGSFAGEET